MKKALLFGVIPVCLALSTIPIWVSSNDIENDESNKAEFLPIFLGDTPPKGFHNQKLGEGINMIPKEKLQKLPAGMQGSISSDGKIEIFKPSSTIEFFDESSEPTSNQRRLSLDQG
ncbi:hypothetical protein [Baia soyae]|uniref:Uncharacterized protein n=1 Tax=Baia soyae TaxID=1544746 RepID=A0A4R2RNQ5_9BACL|nr:hypothetical protein [Baia soyae]TCP60825.1 hypothetical protein EDD57_1678 [Baia soyae]